MTQHRKLAAIVSADVAGYSRLMSEDEHATLGTLTAHRRLLADHVSEHGGRVVDSPGDALLAEFPSAIEAVKAAAKIQRALAERNVARPEDRGMQWRIGINLGDVIEEAGALYGDGVNIAARLQALAEPGGICISGTVYDQVEGKLPLGFHSAGEQAVKNIPRPVRAYHVALTPGSKARSSRSPTAVLRAVAVAALVLILTMIAGVVVWRGAHGPSAPVNPIDPVYAMPTGPRIAVLPFVNMSGDPAQDYFSDGLTEDIITELSRFRDLYVLARNTTYQYKGQAVDIPALGRKLGVQYMLEGSVQKAGNEVRITAQLIDIQSGVHLWADRYDRSLNDIFVVQDEIARRIAGSIAGGPGGTVQAVARQAMASKSEDQLKAYDYVLRATLATEWWKPEEYPKAKAALEKAIALDPGSARARQSYAWVTLLGWIFRYEKGPTPGRQFKENAIRSVELDPANPHAHLAAAFGYYFDKQFEQFERETSRALDLAPNNPEVLAPLAFLITIHGQWERGVKLATKAHDLNAVSADGWYNSALFYDFHRRGMYREAIEALKTHPNPGIVENLQKYTAAYAELGDLQRAQDYWNKCKELDPTWSAEKLNAIGDLWNFDKAFWKHYMQSIAKAGYRLSQ